MHNHRIFGSLFVAGLLFTAARWVVRHVRTMHLVQLLLPIRDESGRPFPRDPYDRLAALLADRFGGVTAYTRAPATGLWESEAGERVRDEVVVYEVMVEALDRAWWSAFRCELEAQFAQDEIVIRAQAIERL